MLALRDFFSFFRSIGLGLAFALAAAILLSVPSQIVELYTSAFSDPVFVESAGSPEDAGGQGLSLATLLKFVIPSLFFAAFIATLFVTTLLSIQRYAIKQDELDAASVKGFSMASILIAQLIALLPAIFVVLAVYGHYYDQFNPAPPPGAPTLPFFERNAAFLERNTVPLLVSLGVIVTLVLVNFIVKWLVSPERPRLSSYVSMPIWFRVAAPIILIGLFVATIADAIVNNSLFTQVASTGIGPLAVILLFLITIRIFVSMSESFYYSTGVPAGFLVIMALVIVGGLDASSDRSSVRTLDDKEIPEDLVADLSGVFENWLNERKDRDQFDRYPVYVIAAEGGGLYAAEHTASVLAHLQDRCPAFAQHIFAISAVSGGALGAAAFNAALAENDHQQVTEKCAVLGGRAPVSEAQITGTTGRFLQHDFLSPTLWTFLFLDLPLAILPAQIVQHDRAIALENTFERHWRTASENKPEYFEGELSGTWDVTGALPALFMNAARVGSGRAELVAPLPTHEPDQSAALGYVKQVRLSTAAALSARFPWFSPPAFYRPPETLGPPFQLVDGGLYDNSGVDQALAIIDLITANKRPDELKYDFRLLIIAAEAQRDEVTYGGLIAPIAALNSARENYGYLSRDRAVAVLCKNCDEDEVIQSADNAVLAHELDVRELPLGWLLSTTSRNQIRSETYVESSGCTVDPEELQFVFGPELAQNRRNCFSTAVLEQLSK